MAATTATRAFSAFSAVQALFRLDMDFTDLNLTAYGAGISPVLELTMYDRTMFLDNVSPDDWLEAHHGLTAVPDR